MAKPDSERGRYGAWIRRNRKRMFGNNLDGLTNALRGMGVAGESDTIRGWEAGSDPSQDALSALAQVFGEPVPESAPADDVVAAIDRLTAAVQAQTAMLAMQIEGQRAMMRGLAGGLAELSEAQPADPSTPSPARAVR